MGRKPDPREIVLIALYAEHLKPDGDFNNVRAKRLNMDSRAFLWALMQLRTEELIGGVSWIPPGTMNPDKVSSLLRDNLHLLHAGYEEAERFIDAKGAERADKFMRASAWFAQAGLQTLAIAVDAGLI